MGERTNCRQVPGEGGGSGSPWEPTALPIFVVVGWASVVMAVSPAAVEK